MDQLVTRIEHLSTGVANLDATRQLREDNLLLRKDLQQYRERELLLLSRMETLENKLSDGKEIKMKRPISRRRISSSESESNLPLIHGEQLNLEESKPRSRSNSKNGQCPKKGNNLDENLSVTPKTKQALMSPSKTKKMMTKVASSASLSSSSEENKPKILDASASSLPKSRPITPKEFNSLQTEIQIARSDNSILRQDIQVFRERESQLYRRNVELEDKLLDQSNVILNLGGKRKDPIGSEDDDDDKDDKTEVNINVDFHTTDLNKTKVIFTEDSEKTTKGEDKIKIDETKRVEQKIKIDDTKRVEQKKKNQNKSRKTVSYKKGR